MGIYKWSVLRLNFDYFLLFFQAKGGSIAFLKDDSSMDAATKARRGEEASLLVYINGFHEFIIFDPRNNEELQISKRIQKSIQTDEPG
jgi:NET1-associated nuclear protein 1 (U3 small nucleolar RNA-associated protein 17)